jgi:hypothetical protein
MSGLECLQVSLEEHKTVEKPVSLRLPTLTPKTQILNESGIACVERASGLQRLF